MKKIIEKEVLNHSNSTCSDVLLIIYGAGKNGRRYYEFLKAQGKEDIIYGFCDRNYAEIGYVEDKKVFSYEEAKKIGIPFLVSVEGVEEIKEQLAKDNQEYYSDIRQWIKHFCVGNDEKLKWLMEYYIQGDCENGQQQRKPVRETQGYCPCCEENTFFIAKNYWLRDYYQCISCGSIPRQRALMKVLAEEVPDWRKRSMHESSPSGITFTFLKEQCGEYTYSYWYEDKEKGEQLGENKTNQNLEEMTFEDEMFDVFITQDVLEHVNYPEKVLQEIARTLKPGGKHIFTVPIYVLQKSRPRIIMHNGERELILPAVYHGNPISEDGSLVTFDWGNDIAEWIDEVTGMQSKIISFPHCQENFENGLEADFLYVVVSEKR